MRFMKILLGCLLLSWCTAACAAGPGNDGSSKLPGVGNQKVYEVEVEAPLPSNVRHPGCLKYREEKYCKKLIKKRCQKWDKRCAEYDYSDRNNPRCVKYERKCMQWSKEKCLEWGTKLVCEEWREDLRRAPAPGSTVNPSKR